MLKKTTLMPEGLMLPAKAYNLFLIKRFELMIFCTVLFIQNIDICLEAKLLYISESASLTNNYSFKLAIFYSSL